jgi:gluconolactonase
MTSGAENSLVEAGSALERLFTGAAWTEGPVWLPESHCVRFSDIPNDRTLLYDAATGVTSVAREPAGYANGRTLDRAGRVVQCSHGRRAVEFDVDDGPPRTIVDRWRQRRFNSPNDVVVAADGSVWFTDPPYGIHSSGREGHPGEPEYDGCFVFRCEPATGAVGPVVTDMTHPNGLAFSPDESALYVADSARLWIEDGPHHVRRYPVAGPEVVGEGEVFAEIEHGVPDGLRVDVLGRLWVSAADGLHVFGPDGAHLTHVPVPEVVGNLCFGGADGSDLYITASTSLYRIRTTTRPAPPA